MQGLHAVVPRFPTRGSAMVTRQDQEWFRADDEMASEMEELHVSALRLLLVAVGALAILADYCWTIATNKVDIAGFSFMWALLVVAGISDWSLRFGGDSCVNQSASCTSRSWGRMRVGERRKAGRPSSAATRATIREAQKVTVTCRRTASQPR
jgi:hypothetical protein